MSISRYHFILKGDDVAHDDVVYGVVTCNDKSHYDILHMLWQKRKCLRVGLGYYHVNFSFQKVEI